MTIEELRAEWDELYNRPGYILSSSKELDKTCDMAFFATTVVPLLFKHIDRLLVFVSEHAKPEELKNVTEPEWFESLKNETVQIQMEDLRLDEFDSKREATSLVRRQED